MAENGIFHIARVPGLLSALSLKTSDVPSAMTRVFFICGEHNFCYSLYGLRDQAARLEMV